MAQVVTTLDAIARMRPVPGLRIRVEQRLLAVLEAAKEIERLPGGGLVSTEAPLVTRVGDYEVIYSLDLEHDRTVVLDVQLFEESQAAGQPDSELPPADTARHLA